MSFDHGAPGVKPATAQIQAHCGPTPFTPRPGAWIFADGLPEIVWGALVLVASLAAQGSTCDPIIRVVSLRLANEALQRGWQAHEAWSDEARYAGDRYLAVDLDAARDELARAGAALRALEQQLVGDPPPRTTTVRPRDVARPAFAAGGAR